MSTLEVKELSHPAGEVLKIAAGKTLDLNSQGTVKMPAGSVIQVINANVQVSGSIAGGSPNEVNGLLLYSVSFTPVSASSRVIVMTSTVLTHETSNTGNLRWLGAWADQYQIGVNSATAIYTAFNGSLNTAYISLNHGIDSWGTTARTIVVRSGGDGAGFVNTQAYNDYASSNREIGITLMEVSA